MSTDPVIRPSGARASDAKAVHALHNYCAATLAPDDLDERVIRRRLLLLSAMLRETALTVFGDVEPEALASVESFWERRRQGERDTDDA